MDLNKLLSQLGVGAGKEAVYMSITPGVGLEVIQLDTSAKTVKNYSCRPLEYNESLREIGDMEAFKNAVSELFEELRIPLKSNVVLNLPMVIFGSTDLPILLADDAVTEAITSEVEQSYIFRRYEPIVSWYDSNNNRSGESRKLFYSAIQKNVVEEIVNALTELGIKLTSIEVSLTSLLKALAFTGLAEEQMKDNNSWNLMLVTQSGYSIVSLVGKNIIDYYEEPLAIKSFEGDEIYNAINASAQITLMSYPANSLYIISETDMVSAELLVNRMHSDIPVKYWDNNDFKKQDALPVSLDVLEEVAHKISLEAIGVASGNSVGLPVKFNFMTGTASDSSSFDPNEPVHVVLGSKEFDISPNAARNVSLLIAIIVLIPVMGIFFGVPMIVNQKQALLDDVNSRLEQTNAEIKRIQDEQNKTNNFDVNTEIKNVLASNRSKLLAYTALGESVPKKLWLTYFVAKDDGKFDIKGEAMNVEDIYKFFRNMKDSLINTKLRLHKLQMKSNSVDDAVTIDLNAPAEYEFEITNMSDSEVAELEKANAAKDEKNGDGTQKTTEAEKK